jgi:hypothetical protein
MHETLTNLLVRAHAFLGTDPGPPPPPPPPVDPPPQSASWEIQHEVDFWVKAAKAEQRARVEQREGAVGETAGEGEASSTSSSSGEGEGDEDDSLGRREGGASEADGESEEGSEGTGSALGGMGEGAWFWGSNR